MVFLITSLDVSLNCVFPAFMQCFYFILCIVSSLCAMCKSNKKSFRVKRMYKVGQPKTMRQGFHCQTLYVVWWEGGPVRRPKLGWQQTHMGIGVGYK